jgi:DNA primase
MNEVEEIKARLDVVEVIGQYVQLRKSGRTHKGLCPFHTERTPSFIVSPDRQSWHCFGACGIGGDVIAFVMKKEGLEFPEALRLLAQRAGVPLRERRISEEEDQRRQRLRSANEAAALWYRHLLLNTDAGRIGRNYLDRRGIDNPTAESFLLGYSPSAWEDTRAYLKERGFNDEELLAAGLLVEGESDVHDRFRGRLMFPIWDDRSRVIGFGARALDDSMPKYLNTPQTPLFDKSGVLYGLDKAQAGIRRDGEAVIVEGYMDVIAAHQHGFDNVVASMGTAITERQVRQLKRSGKKLVLVLDADLAGSEATLRTLSQQVDMGTRAEPYNPSPAVVDEDSFQDGVLRIQRGIIAGNVDVDMRVAALPAGKDPDDLIRESADAWKDLLATSKPLMDFWFEAVPKRWDLSDPRQRPKMAQELLRVVQIVDEPVVRAHYLQRLSRLAQVSERELAAMLRRGRGRRAAPRGAAAKEESRLPDSDHGDVREEFLLAMLLRNPDLRPAGREVPENLFWQSENRQVFLAWKNTEGIEAVKEALPVELAAHLERLDLRRLPSFGAREAREALADCRRRLERRQLAAEKRAVMARLVDREEELGPLALAEATDSAVVQDEEQKEVASLHIRDMEMGLELHRKGEREDDGEPVETGIDG